MRSVASVKVCSAPARKPRLIKFWKGSTAIVRDGCNHMADADAVIEMARSVLVTGLHKPHREVKAGTMPVGIAGHEVEKVD